ncbi:MAG: hypothetical protein NT099_06870 [Candidatus Saganbacteria bacterium]|nr:hypothetical protein [Candidatus Saganbacteria bacterium]
MSRKQVRKIVYGRLRNKSDEYIINKIKRSEKNNNTRIGYHLRNKAVLEDEANYKNTLVIRLAVIDGIITELRREKIKLRNELEKCDDERG